MTTGRPPKPTYLKVLQGNPGKRPVNQAEPKPKPSVPTCPRHLDKSARTEWRRVCHELAALGVLSEVDRAALAAYCVAYGRWVDAELQVTKLGTVVKTTNGNLIQNPYLSIANRAMMDMARLAVEFGMTPSSRSRVKSTVIPKPKSEFELYLERKRLQVEGVKPVAEEEHERVA